MKQTSLLVVCITSVALFSCVSSSKHKKIVGDLEQQLSEQRTQNQDLQTTVGSLEEKLLATTKDKGQLRTSLDEMKKAMEEMKQRQQEQKKRLDEFKDLTRRFKRLTDAGTLSVKIVDGKMVVSLGSDLLFAPGSARLSKDGISAVKEVTQQLVSLPSKRYQIEGHTDTVPINTQVFPSNWELASARSLSVMKTMIDSGMPSERVSAASYGEFQSVQANDTPEGRAANRRVEIVIVPDLSSLPGYEELQSYAQ
ncbi:MAG: OmpA family protein [Oligoflexia bacterium]|nr:OmpA family protein [Oligoflexia bacterium]